MLVLLLLIIFVLDVMLFEWMLKDYIQDKARDWLEKKLYWDKK